MTNYQRIINMTKAELAEELKLVANWDRKQKNKAEKNSENFYLDWLSADANPMCELPKLKKLYNNKELELDKEYFVTEWSWNPICDGYSVCTEIIRHVEEIDGFKVYTTGKNFRHYFAWDVHESKEEAEKINNLKNSYAYDWSKIEHGLIDRDKIVNMPY